MYEKDEYMDFRYSRIANLFQDNQGILMTADELDELSAWEIEERQIRVSEF